MFRIKLINESNKRKRIKIKPTNESNQIQTNINFFKENIKLDTRNWHTSSFDENFAYFRARHLKLFNGHGSPRLPEDSSFHGGRKTAHQIILCTYCMIIFGGRANIWADFRDHPITTTLCIAIASSSTAKGSSECIEVLWEKKLLPNDTICSNHSSSRHGHKGALSLSIYLSFSLSTLVFLCEWYGCVTCGSSE